MDMIRIILSVLTFGCVVLHTHGLCNTTLQRCYNCFPQTGNSCRQTMLNVSESECASSLNENLTLVVYNPNYDPGVMTCWLDVCPNSLWSLSQWNSTIYSIGCKKKCDNISVWKYRNRKIIGTPDRTFQTGSHENCVSKCFDDALDDVPCAAVYLLENNMCKIYKSCSSPASFQHAYLGTGTVYEVTCDTVLTPRCCPVPILNDGNVVYNNLIYTVGTIATHTCNPGFALVGNASRTCLNDTSWDGFIPSCDAVDCGDPVSISNGYYSMPYAQTVLYTCDIGYTLNGVAEIACGANNEWPPLPNCTITDCGDPSFIDDGTVLFTSRFYGGIAVYSCNVGYNLSGSANLSCTGDGVWSSNPPNCSIVDCGIPPSIANGSVIFGNTTYLQFANYSCDTGFVLIGQSSHLCPENGSWSQPFCEVDCGAPPNITFGGYVIYNNTNIDSVATYRCNQRCNISGPNQTTCLSNGQWDNPAPNCSCIQCNTLIAPVDGFVVTSDGVNGGSVATYTCMPDYILYGDNVSVCTTHGVWSSPAPICRHRGVSPPRIYIMPCVCNTEHAFANMTPSEITKQLIKDTTIDVKKTSKALQKLNCLEDSRQSSKLIGAAGTVFISVIFGLIIILDCLSVFPRCQSKQIKRTYKTEKFS